MKNTKSIEIVEVLHVCDFVDVSRNYRGFSCVEQL